MSQTPARTAVGPRDEFSARRGNECCIRSRSRCTVLRVNRCLSVVRMCQSIPECHSSSGSGGDSLTDILLRRLLWRRLFHFQYNFPVIDELRSIFSACFTLVRRVSEKICLPNDGSQSFSDRNERHTLACGKGFRSL